MKKLVLFSLLVVVAVFVGCDDDLTGPDWPDIPNDFTDLICNGSFEDGERCWQLDSHHGTAWMSFPESGAAHGNRYARISQLRESPEFYEVMLKQTGITLEAGNWYLVSLWARAESPRSIWLMAMNDAEPYENYGLWHEIILGSDWGHYQYAFRPEVSSRNARFAICMGVTPETIDLDGVILALPNNGRSQQARKIIAAP